MKLSIVIPCYNEAKNIPIILEEYNKIITRDDIEVILVNNNSTDETAARLSDLLPKYPFAKTVFASIAGYGSAILAGLHEAQGEYIGWTHGDLQTPPNDVLKALAVLELNNGTNLYLKGLRKGRPLADQFFTLGMSLFETIYLGKWLYDINAQPNIFHRSFFEKWQNPPIDFSLDLYVLYLAKKNGLNLKRFPVDFKQRIHGESKWNVDWKSKFKFIKRTFLFSISLKKQIRFKV
jgi:glycosyltransferase involved in cell wall biosynthesis